MKNGLGSYHCPSCRVEESMVSSMQARGRKSDPLIYGVVGMILIPHEVGIIPIRLHAGAVPPFLKPDASVLFSTFNFRKHAHLNLQITTVRATWTVYPELLPVTPVPGKNTCFLRNLVIAAVLYEIWTTSLSLYINCEILKVLLHVQEAIRLRQPHCARCTTLQLSARLSPHRHLPRLSLSCCDGATRTAAGLCR